MHPPRLAGYRKCFSFRTRSKVATPAVSCVRQTREHLRSLFAATNRCMDAMSLHAARFVCQHFTGCTSTTSPVSPAILFGNANLGKGKKEFFGLSPAP
jgi:hypothetical protein